MSFEFESHGFRSAAERLEGERSGRIGMSDGILSFGVNFLDVALGGIFPKDVILLGAKTGLGKTALATRIAHSNALKGKRVHYFALEAEDAEIERRIKYNHLSSAIRDYGTTEQYRKLNFLDWYSGAIDSVTRDFEKDIDETLGKSIKTLNTFYKSGDFYLENMEKIALAVQDQTDLIILDHLHYVDSEDANENRAYKSITKKIRDIALSIGKPVIVVAHVRKGDRKNAAMVPGIEDFHGSSDISKICTKAVMIAPAYDQIPPKSYLWPTYLAPLKCRFDGQRTRHVGLVNFDVRTGTYSHAFEIGDIKSEKFEMLDNDKLPEWAKVKGVPL